MARILMQGVLVALGTASEVDGARLAMGDFDNLMFVDARPDQIPWREAYFTKIFVPPEFEGLLRQGSGELHRVLAPGGEIIFQSVEC